MTVLASLYKHTIGRVLSPSAPPFTASKPLSKKRKFDGDNADNAQAEAYQNSRRRKRDEFEESDLIITKKRRVDDDHFTPIVDGEAYETIAIEAPSMADQTPSKPDRFLMPPPPLDVSRRKSRKLEAEDSIMSFMDNEGASQLSVGTRTTQQRTSDDFSNDYDMEKARRHAAATTLPTNSGVWERGEKEFFYHLSYRGFEPLLPRIWMKDFPTLPLSIYESEDGETPPLIEVHKKKGEFRAIRALRELLELGKNMRDKVLVDPEVRKEVILEKGIKTYFDWAFTDAGIKLKTKLATDGRGSLPIHVMVKHRPHQPFTVCLTELKAKMHECRQMHYKLRDMVASVEEEAVNYPSPGSAGEGTWLADEGDENLPVIYGFAVVSSLLIVMTLNSLVPAPRTVLVNRLQSSPLIGSNEDLSMLAEVEGDDRSDPRFLSEFDFSDPARDVWNALVVAIAAMQIRRDMEMDASRAPEAQILQDVMAGIEHANVVDNDEDDPDK